MQKLKSIRINGFRGQVRPVLIEFQPDANFIIGRNGTGKTTLINLINAAMKVDIDQLNNAEFTEIEMKFSYQSKRNICTVHIKRVKISSKFSDGFTYEIKRSSSDVGNKFDLTKTSSAHVKFVDGRQVLRERQFERRNLLVSLKDIYNVCWLSLRRNEEIIEFDEFDADDGVGTDVDRKLHQVLIGISSYFSQLDRLAADNTRKFQKAWFLSFLSIGDIFNIRKFSHIDFQEQRKVLESIFKKFDMYEGDYKEKLDEHFSFIHKINVTQKIDERAIASIMNSNRLNALADEWRDLQDHQHEIYRPRYSLIQICNSMLYNKIVDINEFNGLMVISKSGMNIPIRNLSSGEKQLLIFLGETTLQRGGAYIFLADEPELSLHVEWQESLVPNLLSINNNAQVIFATHSPDIVGKYQGNVIKMEEIVD